MILVCGGGPSGVAAAVTAAENGSEVVLIEKNECLGGTLTASLIGIVLDEKNKSGFIRRFCDRVNNEVNESGAPVYEAEKYILEDMCLKAGVKLLYGTFISEIKAENGRITEVITVSKSGKKAYYPDVVIDATGDGDIAYMAGCEYEVGNEEGATQPMSMVAVVAGIDGDEAESMLASPEKDFWESRNNFNGLLNKLGIKTSMGACANITRINETLYYISINHQYGTRFDSAEDLTKATVEARKEIYETVKALKKHGGPFKNITLASTPQTIGVREGRRIKGKDSVTIDDLLNGNIQNDSVCTVTYWVDIHSLTKDNKKGFSGDNITVKPYGIPMGALIPKNTENLLLSGRNLSGDFYAHASYRVVGNMGSTGQAAGAMAHIMDKNKISSYELKFEMIKDMLN